MSRLAFASFLLALLAVASAGAQVPRVLRDINTAPAPVAESAPKSFAAVGSDIYFNAYTPEFGFEVYRTRGTAATTTFVADAMPGVDSSHAAHFVTAGAWTVFFSTIGMRLYRTDGTAAGTSQIFDFGTPVKVAGAPAARSFRGRAIVASRGLRGSPVHVLVASDGTPAGTIELATFPAMFGAVESFESFIEFGNELWFLVPSGLRHDLWRTDGTVAGTRSLQAGGQPRLGPLASFSGALFFTASDGLWRTDGTSAGTTRVFSSTNLSGGVYVLGNRVIFTSLNTLYVSDGTPTGTLPLITFARWFGFLFVPWRGALYFTADDGVRGNELWRTDGTTVGTQLVVELTPGVAGTYYREMVALRDRLLLLAGSAGDLWTSDGSAAGTTRLSGVTEPRNLTADAQGTYAVFSATDAARGRELWRTDGTPLGTLLVADLWSTPPRTSASDPGAFVQLHGRTLFFATDSRGTELWRTDGTSTGTQFVADLWPGSGSSLGSFGMTEVGGHAYFAADDGVTGQELWRSDGTVAGTVMVADLVPGPVGGGALWITALDDQRLVFVASDPRPGQGEELWVSDGSASGTRMLDINPSGGSMPQYLVRLGRSVVFIAYHPTYGHEPWITDGTALGTRLIADVVQGPTGIAGYGLVAHEGAVYFLGSGDLWRTDGTANGTWRVVSNVVAPPASANGRLYFAANSGGAYGVEPWISDGTTAGSMMLADLVPGPASSNPSAFVALASTSVFFTASGATGTLWRTNGTGPSTTPLASGFWFGAAPLLASGRFAWFRSGHDLWRTDGTQAGTQLAISGLALSPRSAPLGRIGDKIIVARDDGVLSSEPWIVDERAGAQRLGVGCGDPFPLGLTSHDPVLGALMRASAAPAQPGALAVFLLGQVPWTPLVLTPGSCALQVAATTLISLQPMAAAGAGYEVTLRVPMQASLAGARLMAQALRSGNGWFGIDLSNGLELTIGR